MSLSTPTPNESRSFQRSNAVTLFWLALLSFVAALVIFLLLQRLGLPTEIVIGAIIIGSISVFVGLAWISRTMTSSLFFHANRTLGPLTSGLGSMTDILPGSMLILMFSTHLAGKMALATGLALGVLLQGALFSAAFQKSGVSSLPGYFAWRLQRQTTGYLALIAVFAILAMLALAEFQIAISIVQVLTGLPPELTVWIIVLLAVLPSVFGGWTGLLLVNATLAIWALVCTLAPATAVGFFAQILRPTVNPDVLGAPLDALSLAPSIVLFGPDGAASAATLVVTVLAIAAGTSILPQALSRISTNNGDVEAIESVGWLALTIFLMLSALPLSLGLVVSAPTSVNLASVLDNQPVLQILPYFVILFAALNALAATLFNAASSVVRASSRLRRLDPGEQSVFSTRLGVLLLAGILLKWPVSLTPSPEQLLTAALMIGAGGLFVPMVVSTWFGALSAWAMSASILGGTITTLLLLSPINAVLTIPVGWAGISGAIVAAVILVAHWYYGKMRKRSLEMNSSAKLLRRH
ncbi:MAG: hypothetical protein ABJM29_02915 [Rhizobiaceae bacterium]